MNKYVFVIALLGLMGRVLFVKMLILTESLSALPIEQV